MSVGILEFSQIIDRRALYEFGKNPNFHAHIRDKACRALASKLGDHIGEPKVLPHDRPFCQRYVYSIAIGDIADQDAIRKAISDEAQRLAQGMLDEAVTKAVEDIQHWGSHAGWNSIDKDTACRFAREAARSVQTVSNKLGVNKT
jgi:hypothetical protein